VQPAMASSGRTPRPRLPSAASSVRTTATERRRARSALRLKTDNVAACASPQRLCQRTRSRRRSGPQIFQRACEAPLTSRRRALFPRKSRFQFQPRFEREKALAAPHSTRRESSALMASYQPDEASCSPRPAPHLAASRSARFCARARRTVTVKKCPAALSDDSLETKPGARRAPVQERSRHSTLWEPSQRSQPSASSPALHFYARSQRPSAGDALSFYTSGDSCGDQLEATASGNLRE